MSIDLLDKTRRVNRLLQDNKSSKVAFTDICDVLGELLKSNVYVMSQKGKILGIFFYEGERVLQSFPKEVGMHINTKMNERFLNILSTKENVNLENIGVPKEEKGDLEALISPISIAGERLGSLFLYRSHEPYGIEDIILSEYGTTVVGLEMMRSVKEETDSARRKKKLCASAVTTLSALERQAMADVFYELDGMEGTLVTSKLAQKVGITRTVIVNGLRKLESAGIIETRSSGMKGTHIIVVNEMVLKEFDDYYI